MNQGPFRVNTYKIAGLLSIKNIFGAPANGFFLFDIENTGHPGSHLQLKTFVARDAQGRGSVSCQPAIGQIRFPDKRSAHGNGIYFFQGFFYGFRVPPSLD
jgi:hypothetical protein